MRITFNINEECSAVLTEAGAVRLQKKGKPVNAGDTIREQLWILMDLFDGDFDSAFVSGNLTIQK